MLALSHRRRKIEVEMFVMYNYNLFQLLPSIVYMQSQSKLMDVDVYYACVIMVLGYISNQTVML